MSDFDIIHNSIALIRTHCTHHHHWVADSLEGRVERWKNLEAENADLKRQLAEMSFKQRWNIEEGQNGNLLICRGLHEKEEKCQHEEYASASRINDLKRQLDEARNDLNLEKGRKAEYKRQLAEAQKDAERYRWLRDNTPWSSNLETRTFYLRAKNYTGFDDAVDAAIAAAPSPSQSHQPKP